MIVPTLRAIAKVLALLIYIPASLPVQGLCTLLGRGQNFQRVWHQGLCVILGLRAEVVGKPLNTDYTLYVGNHLSHLDVPLLGQYVRASFVAKDDINSWPVFGWVARMQRTIFISRDSRNAEKVRDTLRNALRREKSLVIFPEGTSSAGENVLPFKSSIFSAFVFQDVLVQPFTLDLLEVDGRAPQTTTERDAYAYYGDMIFVPHLWSFLKRKSALVRITFHAPLDKITLVDRKVVSLEAYRAVRAALLVRQA